jgi:hypothetical protein
MIAVEPRARVPGPWSSRSPRRCGKSISLIRRLSWISSGQGLEGDSTRFNVARPDLEMR